MFIDEDTIGYVKRVYQDESASSRTVTVDESTLSNPKDLLHIIDSYNNEKMFFADRVLLVEEITDRLIFQAIVDYQLEQNEELSAVEVLEVEGKNNLEKYSSFLDNLGVPGTV